MLGDGLDDFLHGLRRGGIRAPVAQNVEDGREGLLLDDVELIARAGDARRDVVPAREIGAVQALASAQDRAALLLDAAHRVLEVRHRLGVHDRAHQRGGVARVADAHVLIRGDQPPLQLLADRLVRDDAAGAGAALPGRAHRAEQDGGEHQVHVGVGRHHDGVVAAQLEDGAAQPLPHNLRNPVAHPAAAGGRHQRDAPVVQQPVADGGAAPHRQREDGGIVPVRARHLRRDAGAGDRRERRLAGRLPQRGVPAHRRDGRVPAPHRDREVEGGDHPDHAQRVPLLEHAVVGTLGVHGEPVELPREAGREVADVDHLLHFALALGEDLAHLERHQVAQLRLVPAQPLADLAHDLPTLGGRYRAPLEEGLVGALDDAVVLVHGDLAHRRDAGAVDGRMDLEFGPGAHPLAGEAARIHIFEPERRQQLRSA